MIKNEPYGTCQDFFSLISPFFGSATAPKKAGTSNSEGLIQEFVKFGTNIGQRLFQVRNGQSKSQTRKTPLLTSSRGNHDDFIANDPRGTARVAPSPSNYFPTDNAPHIFQIQQNQLYLGQQQQRQQQQTLQLHQNTQPQQQSVSRFQVAQPISNDVIRGSAANFGQEVTRLLGEIAQYSDVHRYQNQDYGSVQKLLNIFFSSMSSSQYDNSRTQWLRPMNDGTEIGRNRPIAKNLFESDIVLTVDQVKGYNLNCFFKLVKEFRLPLGLF
uniref:Uncharacterized protein n=1 Tax=Loa loa TaxID=7209 RepID=A0A1I7VVF6_LOALO